jgi:TonB family protein
VDQLVTSHVAEQRPWRLSRRGGRRLGPVLVISLWLHLTLLLLMLMTVRYGHREEDLPPPSTVAVVFEGGRPEGPAQPRPEAELPAPIPLPAPPPPPPPAPSVAPEAPARPPAPTPPAVAHIPVPPTPPPAPPQAVPQTTAEAPPIPTEPSPPIPLPPPPTPPPAAVPKPTPAAPPPRLAMVVPRPPPTPRPAQPQQPAAPSRPDAFPTPMNFSFNPSAAPSPSRTSPRAPSRGPTTLDFSLAPREGATDNSPFARIAGAHVGPDWRNELAAWVRAHAYYPEQAAMNGEDGDVMVEVTANPDGRVTSVQLQQKSGSRWLDLALQSMFRDARLPPLHDEVDPITFSFLMHYILIRVR